MTRLKFWRSFKKSGAFSSSPALQLSLSRLLPSGSMNVHSQMRKLVCHLNILFSYNRQFFYIISSFTARSRRSEQRIVGWLYLLKTNFSAAMCRIKINACQKQVCFLLPLLSRLCYRWLKKKGEKFIENGEGRVRLYPAFQCCTLVLYDGEASKTH